MTTSKKTATGVVSEQTTTQENLNMMYTAHQVHTLAQLLFQQLAASMQPATPWYPQAGVQAQQPFGTPAFAMGFPGQGSVAFVPAPPRTGPSLFYWYP